MDIIDSLAEFLNLQPAKTPPENAGFLAKMAAVETELKPHQKRVVERIQQQPGLVVAHGLGSGKTLSSIAAAEALGGDTTVVVPAALRKNYEKELNKHVVDPNANYLLDSLQRVSRQGFIPHGDNLIVDEAHRLRDPGSKGFETVSDTDFKKRLFLTGTPLYNNPADIGALVNLAADQKLLPMTSEEFAKKYIAQEKIYPGLWDQVWHGVKPGVVPKLKNEAQLDAILDKWVDYHENTTEGFPSRVDEVVETEFSPEQQKLYRLLLKQMPGWLAQKMKSKLPPSKAEAQQLNAFLSGVRQVSISPGGWDTSMSALDAAKKSPKLMKALENLKAGLAANPDHKALVYSNYLEAGLNPYAALLADAGIPYGMFTGEMSASERNAMVQQYNDGLLKALLVSSAGGEGLDLKKTRQIQMLDPHWNKEKLEQVIGRGIRYKSHDDLPEDQRNVKVEHYRTVHDEPSWLGQLFGSDRPGSVEEYLDQIANAKNQLNEQLRNLLRNEPVQKTAEVYQEGPDSQFSYEGRVYPLDPILRASRDISIQQLPVKKLKWMLNHNPPIDQTRIDKADISIPILVMPWKKKLLVIDGSHRLSKAVTLGMSHLPAILLSEDLLNKTAEYAPGIPEKGRIKSLPTDKISRDTEFVVHEHKADKAGLHYDLRIADGNMAHSWAIRKGLPAPGTKHLAVRQPTHTKDYMSFSGNIEQGYGRGRVGISDRGEVRIIESRPDKIRFVLTGKQDPEEFVLFKPGGKFGKNDWLISNITPTRDSKPDIPVAKPPYRTAKPEQLANYYDPQYLISAKLDGAHAITEFPKRSKGKEDTGHPRVYSYRPSQRSDRLINHTYRIPGMDDFVYPKSLEGTIVRGEVYGVRKDTGEAIPSNELSGILNSTTANARARQESEGITLKNAIFDVLKYRGKDVSNLPYSEKLKILNEINDKTPDFIELPDMAKTPNEKQELFKRIQDGHHPATDEGVIAWNLDAGAPPVKIKLRPDHDVFVRNIFPGQGKYKDTHAGGFEYSLTPRGKIVGRVGTGFTDEMRKDMWEHPHKYKGKVAKVTSQEQFKSKAFRAPAFTGQWHMDK